MKNMNSLKNFKFKVGEPNFLFGIAGNGISTSIQKEMYTLELEDVHYLNYINLPNTDESYVLLEIVNTIVSSRTGLKLTEELIEGFHTPFNVFRAAIEAIKNAEKDENQEILIIFDEFHRIKDYSNAFFFTLDKILSITKIIPELNVTSILISDEYINPQEQPLQEGLGKLLYHHPSLSVIKALDIEQIKEKKFKVLKEADEKLVKRVFDLGGFNPSTLISIADILINDETDEKSLLDNYDLEWKFQEIWDSIGKPNQEILKKIVSNKIFVFENSFQKKYLTESGILNTDTLKINSRLLKDFVTRQLEEEMENKPEYLKLLNTLIYLPDLSPQLEKILLLLHENKGSVVSRDEIAKTIWGEENYIDKYSDYSIDKQISKLRKVIEASKGNPEILETKKGKGYLLNI